MAHRLFSEYRSSIKGLYVEEIMDLVLYRPISFFLVKLCYPYPITPNQLSFMAMGTGILAGVFFSLGTYESFVVGGLFFALANVIDCSDGMLARLKQNGTLTGRIVDGFVDYVVSISFYAGLAKGLERAVAAGTIELPFNPWLLGAVAGASNILSSGITDHFRNLYESHVFGKTVSPVAELRLFKKELRRLNRRGGRRLDKLMIWSYIKYTQIQLGRNQKPFLRRDADAYHRYNRWLLLLWNLIGPTTHISVMIVSAFLFRPMIYFTYAILFANSWIVLLFPIQWWVNRRVAAQSA